MRGGERQEWGRTSGVRDEARASRRGGSKGLQDRKARKLEMRIATLNLNGFGNLIRDHDDNKWSTMYRMIKEQRIAILMVQETHLTEERCNELRRIFASKIKIMHSEHPLTPTTKEGVAFVLNKSIINTAGAKVRTIVPGRALQLSIEWRDGKMRHLLCIYAPTSNGQTERKTFFENVKTFYAENADVPKPHLMAGDFNVTESELDRSPHRPNRSDNSMGALEDLKLSLNLMSTDGWRMTYPTKKDYTFFRKSNGISAMSRLDRIYVRSDVFPWTRNWDIRPVGVRTDHSLVSVCMTTPRSPEVGRGRSLFPLQLLGNKALKKEMKECGVRAMQELSKIREQGRTVGSNPQIVLHILKTEWMELARKREKAMMPKLVGEIEGLEKELRRRKNAESPNEEEWNDDIEAATRHLKASKESKLKVQQYASRAKHRKDGERPTKYWTRLHKEQKPRELIPALVIPGAVNVAGERVYEENADRMAELARAHFDKVQVDSLPDPDGRNRSSDIMEVMENVTARLTEEQQVRVGSDITWDDCEEALIGAKNGTAPGLDGVQYEVWKTMHERFKEDRRHPERTKVDVVDILREAFLDMQKYGVSERTDFAQGWMSPIYKEKGERTDIVNYRPITLLNTDYKLLTKVLAIRL
ncbi:DNase I-like protein, partial [Trametes coccinea BRFM310]